MHRIASHRIALHLLILHAPGARQNIQMRKKITLAGTNDRNQKQRGLTNDDRRSKGDLQRT